MRHTIRQLEKSEWPELLHEIPDSPNELYVRGSLPDPNNKILCVVGSRKYSPYGKEVCEKLISGLRGYDITILSGLALGIDSIAHKSALDARLATIAVPGSGLNDDVLYPSTNKALARRILESGGALISEFEPEFKATAYSFPQRNRIMAGISHAVLVVEAADKSGTLITARLATDYNRDLMTVPGSIFSQNSNGPHMLIRLGATPVRSSGDILEVLGLSEKKKKAAYPVNLSESERKILKLLVTPMPRDELIKNLDMSTSEANVLLSSMELRGLILEKLGKVRIP